MRLLRVEDLRFHEVPSHGPLPRYAILSHTWIRPSHDEVTYQDLASLDETHFRSKAGWNKIQYTVVQACQDNIPYIWVDTCCINKLDPTELSEAINCMYNWYGMSAVCYVYLSDIHVFEDQADAIAAMGASKWFTRGWTLQELIAPSLVTFYNKNWVQITTRAKSATYISTITKVDATLLRYSNVDKSSPGGIGAAQLQRYSIAQRMSWAAERKTTRSEDRAYSLLGLFGIVMPLHYGEGAEHSFKRLQQEIIRQYSDQSILAWEWPASMAPRTFSDIVESPAPFLAPNPECFQTRGHVIPARARRNFAYSINNVGLEIEAYLVKFKSAQLQQYGESDNLKQLVSRSISMRPEPPITPLRRSKPLSETEEYSDSFVGAIIDCSCSLDPSMVYMLPLESAPGGCFFLTGRMHCEQLDWIDLESQMEPCHLGKRWTTITVLRAPLQLLRERNVEEDGISCAKLHLSTDAVNGLQLKAQAFWPPDQWNQSAMAFLPRHTNTSLKSAGFSVTFSELHSNLRDELKYLRRRTHRALQFHIAEHTEPTRSQVVVAFCYGWGKLLNIQADRLGPRIDSLQILETVCQRLEEGGHSSRHDLGDSAYYLELTADTDLAVKVERTKTPCDEFWLVKVGLENSTPEQRIERHRMDGRPE